MKSNKLKVGIVGVGRFGSRHLEKWLSMDGIDFIGFNDIDADVCNKIETNFACKSYDLDSLIEKADLIDIVVPAASHFPIAAKALKAGKHVFVEKPFTETSDEAKKLANLADDANVKIGIGHIERFNPVYKLLREQMDGVPHAIMAFRQGPFIPGNGLDVSIILELMVHDIDIVLQLIPYPVTSIQATGEIIHSDKIDRATAILTFENGSKAVLFASRAEDHRRREILCETSGNAYKANLMERKFQVSGEKEQQIGPYDAMYDELEAFVAAIDSGRDHVVNQEDGVRSIEIATKIENLILNS